MLREAFFRVVETAEFAAEMQERTAGPAGAGLNFPDKDRMIAAREAFIELANKCRKRVSQKWRIGALQQGNPRKLVSG